MSAACASKTCLPAGKMTTVSYKTFFSWWANHMHKMLGMNRPLVTVLLTSIYLTQWKKKTTPCQDDNLRVSDVLNDIKTLLFPFHPSLTVLVSPCIGVTSNSLNSALFWMKLVLTSCCRESLDKHLYFVCVCPWEAPSDHIHWSACGSCLLLIRDRSYLCPALILYVFFVVVVYFNSSCSPCHLFSHSHSFPKYIPFLSGSLILIFWPFVPSFQLTFFLKPCFFLLLLLCLLLYLPPLPYNQFILTSSPASLPLLQLWPFRSSPEALTIPLKPLRLYTFICDAHTLHTTHKTLSHLCPSASACQMYSFNFIQTCILSRITSHPPSNKTLTHSQVGQCKYPHTNKLPRRLSPLLLVSTHIHPGARWWLVAPVTWLHRGDTTSVTLTAGISQRSTNYGTLGMDGGEEGWWQNGGGE